MQVYVLRRSAKEGPLKKFRFFATNERSIHLMMGMSLNDQIENIALPTFTSELEKKVFYRFVEMRAHQLWIAEGRVEGHSDDQWKRAEAEMARNWRGEYFPRMETLEVAIEKKAL